MADDYPFDMGKHRWEVSTSSKAAQEWFQRGLNWGYGFNHEEALHCFKECVKADENCVMGFWGLAWMSGPNYNCPEIFPGEKDWDDPNPEPIGFPTAKAADQAISKAMELVEAGQDDELEKKLVKAMRTRVEFPYVPGSDERKKLDKAYQEAMKQVHEEYPDHQDVLALYVESVLQLRPWSLYDKVKGEPFEEGRLARKLLEDGLERWPEHPQLCHLYVHVMEMSPTPEAALEAAETLRRRVSPASGHLLHMPSHLDVLLGRFQQAIDTNAEACKIDAELTKLRGPVSFYMLYNIHNMHFIVYAAMFLANYEKALKAANDIVQRTPQALMYVPEMADWLEAYQPMHMHVYIRFGKWQEILDAKLPDDPKVYSYSTAVAYYAKTIACASLRRVEEADSYFAKFKEAVSNVQETRKLFQNPCHKLLSLAEKVAQGEILYRKGSTKEAFALLEQAVAEDDMLNYDEPWGWMLPGRHVLGALLLESGELERAEAVYRKDLQPARVGVGHPENVWSLRGLLDCLKAKSNDPEAEKERVEIEKKLKELSTKSDTPVKASCMCALELVAKAG
mmetsp:Transcript_46/g.136  ORF Transcript_46/g.136 Transcript_46/m.136 type:complete len:565 (+) Transcript_46:98-1792(+)|eukprot:CAMPEP_0198727586 /NCGR_PEP_ID=MMETSP1475-20131203/4524_1 /TAXON_ID= ORGANISM="Unidentified sp., Strain CCMP1999" /NCGR_SAMPLE_ID=MMETSP1475 /ASSEMBLY_ACC=CAM_ASM_001111 /LENGTH=564 /DNA_ID=CAMNT_0044489645 /DNA_START=31 /DNA_END=1725 /DNA_ORIENTATION=-